MSNAMSRRRGTWARMAGVGCVVLGAIVGSAWGQGGGGARDASRRPIDSAPKLTVTHCEASVRVTMPQSSGPKSRYVSRNFEVYARLDVAGGAAPSWCEKFEIVELRDAEGKDLLAGINRRREPDSMRRYNVAQQLANQYIHKQPNNTTVTDSVRNLKELPTKLSLVKVRADLITSRKPVLVKVPLKVMDAPMTLVPGVTVLVTRIEEQKSSMTAWMEIRSRLPEAGSPSGASDATKGATRPEIELARPMVAGVVFRNHDGDIGGIMPLTQTIELHDESIMVAQGLPISDGQLASDGTLEILILDQMEQVQVETTLENVDLASGGERAPE